MWFGIAHQHFDRSKTPRQRAEAPGIVLIRLFCLLRQAGNPKIEHLNPAGCRDEHVVWLQVTMHNTLAVCIGESLGELAHQVRPIKRFSQSLLQPI